MEAAKTNMSLLKLLFEQPDAYKFVIGIFVLFVVPQIINIFNTIVKNKNTKEFNNDIMTRVEDLGSDVTLVKDRINQIYTDNFEECTNNQIEYMFRGRVSIDIDLLVKNTKQVIIVNHIENREITRLKVNAYCNTVIANTKIVMNYCKRNGVPCGAFINSNEWKDNTSSTILAFIYSNEINETKGRSSHNYETLKFQLKSLYDTFTVEFINRVNEECLV